VKEKTMKEEIGREVGRDLGIPPQTPIELAHEKGPMSRAQFTLAVKLLGEKRALELAELYGVTEEEA
jgi:hypothetical protein